MQVRYERSLMLNWVKAFLLCCLLLCSLKGLIQPQQVSSQENKPSSEIPALQLNQYLTGELKAGGSHTYKLSLDATMFVRVVVRQQGVDVFVRAFDGQKNRLTRVNDPFGRVGLETLEFVAETAGDYFIEVNARRDELGG